MENFDYQAYTHYMTPMFREYEWDMRWVLRAHIASLDSKDPSTKCGAVIVRPNKTVASTGYNGFPMGCDDDPEIYANRERKYERVIHAEVNALNFALENVHGCTMYTWPGCFGPTCARCASNVIQRGITRVVHIMPTHDHDFETRWGDSLAEGLTMYSERGVQVNHYMENDYRVWLGSHLFPVEEFIRND